MGLVLMAKKRLQVKLVAVTIALMGLINVASASFFSVTGRLRWLREVLPPEVTLGSRGLVLVAGFFLIAVAWNLAHRKRVAWVLGVWLLLISAFSHLLKGLDVEEASIALALVVWLWLLRREFTVRSDPGSIRDALFAIPYTIVFIFLYALIGFSVLSRQFRPPFKPEAAMVETAKLVSFQGEYPYQPVTRRARWFVESLPMMAGVGIVYVVYSLMRPVLSPEPTRELDRKTAQRLIRRYGSSGIAYFARGKDKTYFINRERSVVVSYVLVRDVALAAGDPIGRPEDIKTTIREFRDYCRQNDWTAAFYQTGGDTLPYYREAGFKSAKIGEEALVYVQSFNTQGKKKNDLRLALNKAKRQGWRFMIFDRAIEDKELRRQLMSLSENWLTDKFGGEMGFTMGGTPILGSEETLLSLVLDQEGKVMAFMTWAPMFQKRGWAGDYMRRAGDAPNGVMDYLIVATIDWMKERGDEVMSLGLAPLANVAADSPDLIISLEKVMKLIYDHFNAFYHFKPLYEFKKKFAPRWESRYLVYPSITTAPPVFYALLRAQMTDLDLREVAKLIKK
jgi:phosphatidylglycerol lysyltransferase